MPSTRKDTSSSAKRCGGRRFCRSSPSFLFCLIGREAYATSHHWARELTKLGHEVRLMPPAYVKPYVKRGKTDMGDAEAICEGVTTASYAVRAEKVGRAAGGAHVRDLLVRQRTQLVNMLRGLLAEFGIEMARGLHHALRLVGQLSKGKAPEGPPLAQLIVKEPADQIGTVQLRLASLEKKLLAWHRSHIFFASDDPPSRAASANDTTASTVSCGQSVFCRAAYGQPSLRQPRDPHVFDPAVEAPGGGP